MKNLFYVIMLAAMCAALPANAQNNVEDNVTGKQFYVEGGGPGVILSVYFDSRFTRDRALGWGYRIGTGFGSRYESESYYEGGDYYYEDYQHSYVTIPMGINYVFGKSTSNHAFEAGAGISILTRKVCLYDYEFENKGNLLGYFSFMYRRQPINGGFTWRIGFTPIIGTGGDIVPSGAIGLGYSF